MHFDEEMGFQYLGPGITVLSPSDPRPPTVVGWLGAYKLASAYRVLWKARRSEPISGTIFYKYKFGIDTSQGVRTQVTPEMSKDF